MDVFGEALDDTRVEDNVQENEPATLQQVFTSIMKPNGTENQQTR